jgi:UDP:flavonoid glycosyltransferase YjiC (YdhE family)
VNIRKKILITPLDWGLGHTTRCIPIIQYLIQEGHDVTVAGSSISIAVFKEAFETIRSIEIPGYSIRYSKKKWQLPFTIFLQIPKIMRRISAEQIWLQQFIRNEKIDFVFQFNSLCIYNSST